MAPRRRLADAFVVLAVLATSSCAAHPRTAPVAAEPAAVEVPRESTLVLGSVSDDPVDEVAEFGPFADVLAGRLAPAGVERVGVRVSGSVAEMAELLRAGEVDVYLDSPYPALTVARESGGTPFLSRWKGGAADYRSVVFVQADSPVRSASELAGALVAMDDEVSTGGYFLPVLALREQGLQVLPEEAPGSDAAVRHTFTDDEQNTLFWVQDGRAEAGAMSEQDLAELTEDAPGAVRVVLTSEAVPRQLAVRGTHLGPARAEAVRAALLGMDDDAPGRAALADFAGTVKFEELPAGAVEGMTAMLARFADGTP